MFSKVFAQTLRAWFYFPEQRSSGEAGFPEGNGDFRKPLARSKAKCTGGIANFSAKTRIRATRTSSSQTLPAGWIATWRGRLMSSRMSQVGTRRRISDSSGALIAAADIHPRLVNGLSPAALCVPREPPDPWLGVRQTGNQIPKQFKAKNIDLQFPLKYNGLMAL